jgi:hypothetical protein
MNSTDDLTRSLQQQADRIGGHPIDLESVRGRARNIQRRRRAGTAVVAAAVLAVAIPAGITVAGGLGRGGTPQPAPPVPTIKPAPKQQDGSFLLSPEDAPEGAVPQVPYIVIDDQRLSTPERSFELPGDVVQLASYGDGWIAIQAGNYPPNGTRVVELDSNFDVTGDPVLPGPRSSGPTLVSNDDGSRVGWVQFEDGDPLLVNSPTAGGTTIRTRVPGNQNTQTAPVGFLADGTLVFTTTDPNTGENQFGYVTTGGEITSFEGFNVLDSTSEATGLVAGQTKFLGDGSCSGVTDPKAGGKLLWDTCDYSLGAFSPDGRFIVGLAAYSDGPGSPSLSILDARTGEPVVDYRGPKARRTFIGVDQVVWEDDDTVLATVTQDTEQSIIRAETNGALSRVAPALPTEGLNIEYRFPNHPFG